MYGENMDRNQILTAMQEAVDIAPESLHPTSKVGATIFGVDANGENYALSYTNHWPERIANAFGHDVKVRIGNASGTIHAEATCILRAPFTEAASLCVTDPLCPNCVKYAIEAGIKDIYIDATGFEGDYYRRHKQEFDVMSLDMCRRAGISVYVVNREDGTIERISKDVPEGYVPSEDSPVQYSRIEKPSEPVFQEAIVESAEEHYGRNYALAFAQNKDGDYVCLVARAHVVPGRSMSNAEDRKEMEENTGKYSYILEPVDRLLMYARRKGLTLCDGYIYSSQVPTAREQVHLVGAGIGGILVGDVTRSRDEAGIAAMQLLKSHRVLSYT